MSRKEDASGGGSLLGTLTTYLQGSGERRDEKRKDEEARRKEEIERKNTVNVLWANNLAQQIDEIRDERKRKFLKIKLTQVVTEYQLADLENVYQVVTFSSSHSPELPNCAK